MKDMILAEIGGHLTIEPFNNPYGYGFGLTRHDYDDNTQVAVIYDGVDRGIGEASSYAELFARCPGMQRLLDEVVAFEAEAFDEDEPVSGADLVQWFADWRGRVRTLLTQPLPPLLPILDPDT